ncbi:hypothetical protein KP509_13G024400 [Ceratopteris richardii]|uniref:Ubiquitin-like protease family profile domain-containing protein n=1 Tax=Ceratopteris richardii TaxID=49495 RepID=A0A8T2TE32_CERRI|nr:hypothetical protein KP509_13G024400 [Ceratopteris richardii]
MPWQGELFLDIRPEDNKMLRELHLEISDSVVNISLRVLLQQCEEKVQRKVFILDPLVTQCFLHKHGDAKSFLRGFTEEVECVIYPYIEKGHWSLIIVDFNAYQALFLNSLPSQHGNCKVAAKLLKMHIDQNFPGIAKMNEQKQFGYSQIHVPLQRDSTSCGWRVIANAVRFLERRFYSPGLNLSDYPDAWIILIRERAINSIMKHAICPHDPDSPPPPPPDRKQSEDKKKGLPLHSPLKHMNNIKSQAETSKKGQKQQRKQGSKKDRKG